MKCRDPLEGARASLAIVRKQIARLQKREARLVAEVERFELVALGQCEMPLVAPATVTMNAQGWTHWTAAEIAILRNHYPTGGAGACVPLLPTRSAHCIRVKAQRLGVKGPLTNRGRPPKGPVLTTVEVATHREAKTPPEADQRHTLPTRPPKPRLSFEEQLALVESGRARIVEVFRPSKAGPDFTLGGVTAYDC